MNIYFVVTNTLLGSAILRGIQISDQLNKNNIPSRVITQKEIPINVKNSIFIWIKDFNLKLISQLSNNFHIYDILDSYVSKPKSLIHGALDDNAFNNIIVNNIYMLNQIKNKTKFSGKASVIHHHWDPRIIHSKKIHQNQLNFGYFGSIKSLSHTDNFLHYQNLVNNFNIELYDCESGQYTTTLIKEKKDFNFSRNVSAINNLVFNFNCHFSIRDVGTNTFNYKTTSKLATASSLNHNIITTYEKSIEDILPMDYPFILKDSKLSTIIDMIKFVKEDYNNEKTSWNLGLSIMQEIKNKLSIETITIQYINLIKNIYGIK